MPAPLRDEAKALVRLKSLCAPTVAPTLTDEELLDILEQHRIARVWERDTVVRPGELIAPTTPNGFLYQATSMRDQDGNIGGPTGDTEPKWPLSSKWPLWEPVSVDDGLVRFEIGGVETEGLWNIKAAAHAAWLLKASKASGEYATSLEGNGMHPEQVIDNCLRMAAKYAPVRVL